MQHQRSWNDEAWHALFRTRGWAGAGVGAGALALIAMASFNNPFLYAQVNVPVFLALGLALSIHAYPPVTSIRTFSSEVRRATTGMAAAAWASKDRHLAVLGRRDRGQQLLHQWQEICQAAALSTREQHGSDRLIADGRPEFLALVD